MATQPNSMPCDFCKSNCPYYMPELTHVPFYGDNIVQFQNTIITCENEDVCKMWQAFFVNIRK